MARKSSPPPTGEQISQALADLKARILAEMAKIPGLVPGTEAWIAVLAARVDHAIDGTFVQRLRNELLVELPKLAQGEKGPVTPDPVDLA